MRGQTTLIAIVLMIVIFGGVVLFLVSVVEQAEHSEYLKAYAGNSLVSLLRMDTGHIAFPEKCKTIADVLFCSSFTPSFRCGEIRCGELANNMVEVYMPKILKPNMDYHMKYGDSAVGSSVALTRPRKWVASESVSKGDLKLDVTLTISEK